MKRYNEFINEGLLAAMKPKSMKGVLKSLESLSNREKIVKIIKYQLDFDLLPRNEDGVCVYDGWLNCGNNNNVTKLPDNLTVRDSFYCNNTQLKKLPNELIVGGDLYCNNTQITEIPRGLVVGRDFDCCANQIKELPRGLTVGRDLWCGENLVKLELPTDAKIGGKLFN